MSNKRAVCNTDNLIRLSNDVSTELDKIDNENVAYLSKELSDASSSGNKFAMVRNLNRSVSPMKQILGEDSELVKELDDMMISCSGGV